MATFKQRNDKLESCPFSPELHKVKTSYLQIHIIKCPFNPKFAEAARAGCPLDPKPCIFNATHYVPLGGMDEHLANCPSNRYDVLILVNSTERVSTMTPLTHHTIADNGEDWDTSNEPHFVIPGLAGKPVSENPSVPIDNVAYRRMLPCGRKKIMDKRTHNVKANSARRELENGVTFEEPSSVSTVSPDSGSTSKDTSASTTPASESDGSDNVFLDGQFRDYGIRRTFDISKAFNKDALAEQRGCYDSQAVYSSEDDQIFETSEEAVHGSSISSYEDEVLDSPDYTPCGEEFNQEMDEVAYEGDSEYAEVDGVEERSKRDSPLNTTFDAMTVGAMTEVLEVNESGSSSGVADTTIEPEDQSGSSSSVGSSASHSGRQSRKSIKRKMLADLMIDSGFSTRRKKKKLSNYTARMANQKMDSADTSF